MRAFPQVVSVWVQGHSIGPARLRVSGPKKIRRLDGFAAPHDRSGGALPNVFLEFGAEVALASRPKFLLFFEPFGSKVQRPGDHRHDLSLSQRAVASSVYRSLSLYDLFPEGQKVSSCHLGFGQYSIDEIGARYATVVCIDVVETFRFKHIRSIMILVPGRFLGEVP